MPSRKTAILLLLAAGVIGVVAAMLSSTPHPVALKSGTALSEPRPLAEFELTDQRGRPLTREVFAGRWSLVFSGFTNCPDLCPTTLELMTELRRQVHRDDLQFVFVSVDPERDSPEVMARYLQHFDPSFVGATGTRAGVEQFTSAVGLAQVRNPGIGDEYTVDHSTAFVLIDPKARVAGYFQAPHEREALVADLAALPRGAG